MKIDSDILKKLLIAGILLFILVVFAVFDAGVTNGLLKNTDNTSNTKLSLDEIVAPSQGVQLPIQWNDLGKRMVESGVIDEVKFNQLYESRGGLTPELEKLVFGSGNREIVINRENAGVLLNLLWAFGLSNKNQILEEGPMMDPRYGGDASKFASTGGWSLASGNPMDHYSKYLFVTLTPEQQKRVENVSKGVYRPCCGNSTYFPDCNHGMAMLGLLQLLAKEDLSEEEMYDIALAVNSYWFSETYMNIAQYFQMEGVEWKNVDAELALGESFSSASGYRRILSEIQPTKLQGGGSCGV